jgi:hypothetical protein
MKAKNSPPVSNQRNVTFTGPIQLGQVPSSADFGQVADQKNVGRCCRIEIAKATSIHPAKLRFQPLDDSTKGTEGLFSTDAGDMSILEGKKSTPVLRWFQSNEITYWIGFRLNFSATESGSGFYINTVSLTIARSFPGASLEAVLRAEWDYHKPESGNQSSQQKHAQPHWHIYNARIDEGYEDYESAFSRLLAETDETTSPIIDFPTDIIETPSVFGNNIQTNEPTFVEKFHFAMCAHWNRHHQITQWPITESDLPHWVEHCLTYVRYELESKG